MIYQSTLATAARSMPADIQLERALSEFLADESTVRMMVAASEAGRPAVEPIGSDLLREFGDRVRPNPVKQQIGRLVRPIMQSHGFEPHKRRRHVKSTLFTAGTVYRRHPEPIVAVLARHGFHVPVDAVRREICEVAQNVVGDPPFVSRPRVNWARLLGTAPAPQHLQHILLAFSTALDHELTEQGGRRLEALPKHQLTAAQRQRLGLTHLHDDRQNACLSSRLRSAFTFGALCATGFTLPETARLLRSDERTVSDLVKKRSLYITPPAPALPTRLPLFQFHSRGLVPNVENVLPRLDVAIHPVGVFNWFTSPSPDLALKQSDYEPTSPRDWLLHRYSSEPVCRLAASVAVAAPA